MFDSMHRMFNSLKSLLPSSVSSPNYEPAQIDRTLSCLANGSFPNLEAAEATGAVRVLAEMARNNKEELVELVSDFVSAKVVFEQNRELCISFVRQAKDGATEATAEYEKRRVCCFELAPKYVQFEIINLCANELKSLRPQSMVPPGDENACIGMKYWLDDKIQHATYLPPAAGFPLVVTHSMGILMRDLLQQLPHSPHLIIRDQGGKRLPIDCFNPASEGPIGSAALRAFSKSLDLLLKSSILEDTLFDLSSGSPMIQDHDHPSFDVVKLAAIRSADTPWDICKSTFLLNMSLLAELSGAGELAEQTIDRVMENPKRLLSNSFKDDLEGMNSALLAKEIRKKKNTAPSSSSASAPVDTAETPYPVEIPTEKQRFFRALQGGTGETTDLRAFSKTYGRLYSAYKRGFVSLTECLDLVRNGSKVAPTPESSKPWSASLTVPDAQEKPSTSPVNSAAPMVENYEIRGYDSPWFQKWLTTIPAREQRLINKRLDCARKGQFMDHLQLRHDSRLFEFRFHLGEGKRIIFSFSAENEITLHTAGSKKDQNALIIAASNALEKKDNHL